MRSDNKKSLLLASVLCAFSVLLATPLVFSEQNNSVIAQGFKGDTNKGAIVAGALVSTKTDSATTVELATIDTSDRIAGVVNEHPVISISSSNKEIQVVLSGLTRVLVSDINGEIHAGDKITASPIAGVGMRATTDAQVVGTAQNDFDIKKAQSRTIKDTGGASHDVLIGDLPLQVSVTYYQAPISTVLPPFLQDLANGIAGRPVSLIRIILCGFLLLFGFIYIGVLIYSSVRSAVTALGRNPMAAHDIRKSLLQMGAIAIAILGATLLAAYLTLTV